MRITDLYKTIQDLREVYPFNDDETQINIEHDIRTGIKNVVRIRTIDKEREVEVNLEKVVVPDFFPTMGVE